MKTKLSTQDKRNITEIIRKSIQDYNSDFDLPPTTFICKEYSSTSAVNRPVLSILTKPDEEGNFIRLGTIEIEFK